MQSIVSQLLLPMVLAFIMFGIGLTLVPADFVRLRRAKAAVCTGLAMQMLLLPLLALALIIVLPLNPIQAAGLFLVALCPGGATSNLFSYLARGDVALSLALTALVSLISVLSLPLLFNQYLVVNTLENSEFSLPLAMTIKQLCLISVVPVALGMLVRAYFPAWSTRRQNAVKQASIVAMALIIIALIALNPIITKNLLSVQALAVLLLSTGALGTAYALARWCGLRAKIQRTLAIEVGIQNAGTAMVVALTILQRPELAAVPLTYGLLMNIPAIAFVMLVNKNAGEPKSAALTS